MLYVIDLKDQNQQWLGVADIMRAEAHETANAALDRCRTRQWRRRHHARAGDSRRRLVEEILKLIDEDEDIVVLALAAGAGAEGPGPLIGNIARTAGEFPIPIALVPGSLADEDIDAMS